MLETRYRIWAIGPRVGNTATAPIHVGVAGVAKSSTAQLPYVVANELICASLAKVILLPTPPGFLIDHAGVPHFVSLNFNLAGHDLPPINPQALVQALPSFAAGVVVFDTWIANMDRHPGNLAFDAAQNKAQVFDHSHAFYAQGRPALENLTNALGIGGHCLAPHVSDVAHIKFWCERLQRVPDYYIDEVVTSAATVGLPTADVSFCQQFLRDRRVHLYQLLEQHRNSLPSVPAGQW
jgi:hypothetical protein